jgi:peptide deformylase
VQRFSHIHVSARKPNGKLIGVQADGLLARVIQHEMDHLDGVLICDKGEELAEP